MGIFVQYLSEIPSEYELFGVFIANPYGTVAERVVTENFERIAFDIGSKSILARALKWKDASQAEEKFDIRVDDMRPVLVVTDVHPGHWSLKDPMIKIQLGQLETEDMVKHFLDRLARWFKSENLGALSWSSKLQMLNDYTQGFPAIIELNERSTEEAESHSAPPRRVNPRTSVLFLSADPTDASRLRLGQELREIQERLQLARHRDKFALYQRMSARPGDMSQALLDVDPQIVHFSGHGTIDGALCFEDQSGQTHPIQPDALGVLFEQFSDQIACVVLNACYSDVQANAIAEHIDYVIGMNHAIGDGAAIAFAVGFYQALGAGKTIEGAFRLGCAQIGLQRGSPEDLLPTLMGKSVTQSN
jgi:hypothetical protein